MARYVKGWKYLSDNVKEWEFVDEIVTRADEINDLLEEFLELVQDDRFKHALQHDVNELGSDMPKLIKDIQDQASQMNIEVDQCLANSHVGSNRCNGSEICWEQKLALGPAQR